MDDHHHNYITKTKPNHKTNKQTNTCSFPQQRKLLFQKFSRWHVWEGKGAGGTGDGYTRTQRHLRMSFQHLGTTGSGSWDLNPRPRSLESRLASWLSVYVPLLRSRSRLLRCLRSFFFFLLALSESASPLRHKKDCFLFSTASKNSFTCI